MNTLIIDGYNLLKNNPDFANSNKYSLADQRDALITSLISYKSSRNIRLILVFDGDNLDRSLPRELKRGGIEIMYSKPFKTADDLIIRLLEKISSKRQVTIITTDNAIIKTAKTMGAHIITSNKFFSKMKRENQIDEKYSANLTSQEIKEWIEIFEGKKP